MEEEIWLPVRGYEGRYEVSDSGNVRSFVRAKRGEPRQLKHNISNYGYACVSLYDSLGKVKLKRVGRLVAEAFIPNPDNKPFVDHIDCVRTNNNANNLRWVTGTENMRNPLTLASVRKSARARVDRGILPPFKGRGDESRVSKAVCVFFKNGAFLARYGSILLASEATGVSRYRIGRYCCGERMQPKNYIWRFEADCLIINGTPALQTNTQLL